MSLSEKKCNTACQCGFSRIEVYRGKDIKEFIKNCDKRILDLSILEINKSLSVSEVVEKAIDIIKEEAGKELSGEEDD